MKNFISLAAVALFTFQPYFSAVAQDPPTTPVDFKVLVLSQATTDLQLEHKEMAPTYVTQTVPDTCFHDVQHGTREDCHTEYDHQCHTTYENQCHQEAYPVCQNVSQNVCNPVSQQVCQQISRNQCESVPYPVCQNVPQQVCRNEPTQECHSASVPVCQSVPRSVCDTTQQCTTVQDSVCHGAPPNQVCQTVPRRECSPVQSCHTINDSVCHDETRNECSMVDHQACHTEDQQQCHNESRQECHSVPDSVCHEESHQECNVETRSQCHDEYRQACADEAVEHCQDVPRQACETVPNMESEPYACTKDIQVKTGEKLVAHSTAQIHLVVNNFSAFDLSKENLKVQLNAKDVVLTFDHGSNKFVFQVTKKDQQVQSISDVEKQIKVTFTLDVFSLDQLTAISQVKMEAPVLYFDKVSFKLDGPDAHFIPSSFSAAHLKMTQKKGFLGGTATLVDNDFDGSLVKVVDDHFEIDLQSVNVNKVKNKACTLELTVTPASLVDRANLLNSALLDSIPLAPISGSFSGSPISE